VGAPPQIRLRDVRGTKRGTERKGKGRWSGRGKKENRMRSEFPRFAVEASGGENWGERGKLEIGNWKLEIGNREKRR
jgi:hypothetical protein